MPTHRIYTDSAISDLIKEFLSQFKDSNGNYRYVESIDHAFSSGMVTIDTFDFLKTKLDSGMKINELMNMESERFLKGLYRAVAEIYEQRNEPKKIQVLVDCSQEKSSIIEALNQKSIGKIVSVDGIIISRSKVYNAIEKGVYTCPDGHETHIEQTDHNNLKVPVVCENPDCKHRDFELDILKSTFKTYRTISVKSDDDFSLSDDEVQVVLSGSLSEYVEAGDRIEITGIVKLKGIAVGKSKVQTVFQNYLDALNVKKLDDVDQVITTEDEEIFRNLVHETDFYQRMINSIAPSILGYDEIKESLLLQLVRSPDKRKHDGTIVRGWFNIGLWGDSGVAKTAMAEHINQNYPRTQIIGSKGATDVGLTLGIGEDSSGNKVLRAGAFVLNRSYGITIMDEFPRTHPEVINGIYTTVENGIASIAKSGFQATQKADSSLLATGNAYSEDWNDANNLRDNLNISTAMLQRFDFHWIIRDNPSESKDSKIADAILSGVDFDESFKPFQTSMLVKYFKFVRQFHPELSDEVKEHLKKAYVNLRRNPTSKENGISPRHLNTLIRTTLAISRLYQKKYSTIEDAEKAIELVKKNLDQRGISVSESETYTNRQFNRCIAILKELPSATGIDIAALFEKLQSTGTKEEIQQCIADLGKTPSQRENKKYREVISKLRRSPLISIISEKPMVLSYKQEYR